MASPATSGHRLGAVLWSFRREFAAVGLFSGVANLLLLSPTLYMLQVYDRVMLSQSELTLLAVSLITLFLFAALAFAEWVRSRVLVRTSMRLDRQLGTRVFNASFEASLREAGHSPAKAFNDLAQVRQFLTGAGIFAFFDAPWVPIYLAVTFFLHPMLGWLALAFAALQVLLAWIGHHRTVQPALESSRAASELNLYLQGKLRNAETLEAMGMLAALRARWQQRQRRAVARHTASQDVAQRVASLSKFVRYTQQSLTLAAGALLVIDGQLTPGAMIAANVLMARALAPIDMVVSNWRSFVSAQAAWIRLRGLLAAFPPGRSQAPRPRPAGALQVRGLVATAPGRAAPILQGMDLEIAAGQTVVVLGPSGSGKSTLARCLVGIWPDTQGEVLLDGEPLTAWSREALGPHIGYLPQDVELFDGSIADNIARMAKPDAAKVIAAARATGLHDAILRLPKGYDTPIGDAGGVLSGGQRQRLALARALYGEPALLVLDEPNSNLDDAGEAALAEAIRELRRQGRTLVLITHRLNALQLADRVLVLRDGTVAAWGPPASVLPPLRAGTPPGGAGGATPQPA
ncbi:type I secretion system permease/ATPase [Ramlibacter sp. AN1133]|uniref:type I secretion system permease/ATPase n=1 Tax=Ramlibacter sp. AN1133 TaxID=3133429 RepID=UPI0030BCC3E4